MAGQGQLRIDCVDCGFRADAESAGGRPGDLLVEHGRRTGHTLSVTRP